ncbi:hypothetical protein BJ508DRAFT_333310 [Ascobolus immersus RN42]|uniref:Uncharacterized protein n=1 Tax=Ascobolus immersus RN42 TaxID=1160509 RepID=A0A3N4HQ75_ASCIM|nr:hypothetical protein BJ508DRAFT_333310 [Ascobolus immersus RN42]
MARGSRYVDTSDFYDYDSEDSDYDDEAAEVGRDGKMNTGVRSAGIIEPPTITPVPPTVTSPIQPTIPPSIASNYQLPLPGSTPLNSTHTGQANTVRPTTHDPTVFLTRAFESRNRTETRVIEDAATDGSEEEDYDDERSEYDYEMDDQDEMDIDLQLLTDNSDGTPHVTVPLTTIDDLSATEREFLVDNDPDDQFEVPAGYETVWGGRRTGLKESEFNMSVAAFTISHPIPTRAYAAFVEVMQTAKSLDDIRRMPKTLAQAREMFDTRAPNPKLLRKEIKVETKKQLQKIGPTSHIFLADERDIARNTLQDRSLDLHFGIGHRVDETSRPYEADAWHGSIRLSSSGQGKYPEYMDGSSGYVIQSDFAETRPDLVSTVNGSEIPSVIGRVKGIFHDRRRESILHGLLVTTLQPVVLFSELNDDLKASLVHAGYMDDISCPFILKLSPTIEVAATSLYRRLTNIAPSDLVELANTGSIHLPAVPNDLLPHGPETPVNIEFLIEDDEPHKTRRVSKRHPLRSELEIMTYGRDYLVDKFIANPLPVRALASIYFADGFGPYRNNYRSLLALYVKYGNLSSANWRKLYNHHMLTIGPFGCKTDAVVSAVVPFIKELEAGFKVNLRTSTGVEQVFMAAITFLHTGDMQQQAENAGVKAPSGYLSCRICLVEHTDRGDQSVNTAQLGRYLFEMEKHRMRIRDIRAKTDRLKQEAKLGLVVKSPWSKEITTMDEFTFCGIDVFHTELSGMTTRVLDTFFGMFTDTGILAFTKAFRSTNLPPGWSSLQNPSAHLASMSFTDRGRMSLLMPMISKSFIHHSYFSKGPMDVLKEEFRRDVPNNTSIEVYCCQQLLQLLSLLSESNILCFSPVLTEQQRELLPRFAMQLRVFFRRFTGTLNTAKRPNAQFSMDKRPNGHYSVHFKREVEQYGTMDIANVVLEEAKHKESKAKVVFTNKVNIEKQIMIDHARRGTMRATVAGNYEYTHSWLHNVFQDIRTTCPKAIERILPLSLNEKLLEEEELDMDDKVVNIGIFSMPRVGRRIYGTELGQNRALFPFPPKIESNSLFYDKLRGAYANDYKIQLLATGDRKLQYRGKAFAVHSTTEKSWTFLSGRWVRVLNRTYDIACIRSVFSHIRHGETRIFFVVGLPRYHTLDEELQLPMYIYGNDPSTNTTDFDIIGLPAVHGDRFLYATPARVSYPFPVPVAESGAEFFANYTPNTPTDRLFWVHSRLVNF